jgi:hypothetical protein
MTFFGEVYVNGFGTFGALVNSAVTVPVRTVSMLEAPESLPGFVLHEAMKKETEIKRIIGRKAGFQR